jgi:predicted nucleic-acid-binding Zn-ribbon protein
MKQTGKCPKCGSADVISDAKAIDHGDGMSQMDLTVATFRRPEALIFKEQQKTTVSAWVCSDCGYVELYADNPGAIKLPKA